MYESVNVRVEGLKELLASLSNPTVVEVPARALIEEAASIGRKAAVDAISAGTGLAERTINKRIFAPYRGEVYSAMNYKRAESIELGRRVGEYVPFMALVQWIEGDPYLYARRAKISDHETYHSALHVQNEISAKGTKGKRYMLSAAGAVTRALPRLKEELAAKIKRKLGF